MVGRKIVGSIFGAALLAGAVSGPIVAAPVDPVKSRIAGFRDLGSAYKNVNDQLKSETPQLFLVQISAREIQNMAGQIKYWFPAGSGPKRGVKTAAKPEIWKQTAQFKKASEDFAAKADAFAAIAKGRDVAAMQAANKALSATCSSCHKQFRAESKSNG